MSFASMIYILFIGPLKLLFELVFAYAYKLTNHPGLSIIVLSLAINVLVLPLYKRSDAMQEEERAMQAKLQKGVSHIKKVFKGDERMLMLQTYYRQNHYKPTYVLRGATSLFLEIPFFMAAYAFLSNLALLRGVSFGPIADLGKPDGLIVLAGMHINLLPILMTLVNGVSTAIFTKGYPIRTKVQLYGMAAFFLVFLYDSPSGLVFYWTLNNVFSLGKTLAYKMKNPKKFFAIALQIVGIIAVALGLFYYDKLTRRLFMVALGLVLQLPQVLRMMGQKRKRTTIQNEWKPNKKRFIIAALFLSVLMGVVIPSGVIKASPLEFINPVLFYHPLGYVMQSSCLAFGCFLIWMSVFYWLASKKVRVIFEDALCVFCAVAVVDYLFFARNLGTMSTMLQYDNGMNFETQEIVLNLFAVAIVAAGVLFALRRFGRKTTEAMTVALLSLCVLSVVNIVPIQQDVAAYLKSDKQDVDRIEINLSTNGKNVVVIMLDRASNYMLPYILKEKPELVDIFSGFTYYPNTVSFGRSTNSGSAPLYAGYEYTPSEMNKRADESLASKQNEALKVMPVMFLEEGYQVTVFDPTYANYQWIPDLSIYDEYPEIRRAVTHGAFNGTAKIDANEMEGQRRSFFLYSLMKSMPVFMHKTLYEKGNYRRMESIAEKNEKEDDFESYPLNHRQTIETKDKAEGIDSSFMASYSVMSHLNFITKVKNDSENHFLMMSNDMTHDVMLLQTPDYVPAWKVDNQAYDEAHTDRFEVNGRRLNLHDNGNAYAHYHANMAAMLCLGEWLENLKAQGVYDQTRIIIVSDHGLTIPNIEQPEVRVEGSDDNNIMRLSALLLVKDFGADGPLTTDETFMTNADVPTLATANVIDHPTNPFTGKAISSEAKKDKIYLFAGTQWDVKVNNGNAFLPGPWYSVHGDILNSDNWSTEGYGLQPNEEPFKND